MGDQSGRSFIAMPYIAGGSVVNQRSNFRLSIVTDFFWAVVNFFGLLLSSLSPSYGSEPKIGQRPGRADAPGGNGGGGGWGGGGGGGGGFGSGGGRRLGQPNNRYN